MTPLKEKLLARSGRGAKYGLDRMRAALSRLDHPERGLRPVHVAGTNGKGSVCAMVEAIGRAAGLRCGMFTSPHLCRIEERIRIDGEPIEERRFEDALGRVLAIADITFFEVMTLTAMVAMREAAVDLAIFEVGLGGRLDATNVLVDPRCCAIVSIARDHTRILGDDLASIAREKAGILKSGTPVVIGPIAAPAHDAIVEMAHAQGAAPVWTVGSDITFDEGCIALPDARIEGVALSLDGAHQWDNAAVAAGVARQLALSPQAIRQGLGSADWAGRLQRIERDGVTLLIDCAHNEHAMQALADAVSCPPQRTRLVFGAMGDKSWPIMLDTIGPRAHARYYAPPLPELAGRKPASPQALAERLEGAIAATPEEAIGRALADAATGETIIVTGSIFLAGAVLAHLTQTRREMAVAL